MSDETTLSSCPFCRGEAVLKEYKPNVSGVAICKECGARSPICKNDNTGG
jgi:transcription elongation factor Elf1